MKIQKTIWGGGSRGGSGKGGRVGGWGVRVDVNEESKFFGGPGGGSGWWGGVMVDVNKELKFL